jgi:hypothetical protein
MEQQPKDNRKVFVAYGRNIEMKKAMFEFLKALDLFPQDWKDWVASTGKSMPYIGEVLEKAFSDAQAIVILLTPDDEGKMNYNFLTDKDPQYEKQLTPQARQNVIFEAGIAMGYRPNRTIIVQIGNIRPFSDIGGRHTIIMDNSTERRGDLAQRLHTAGCPTNTYTDAYFKAGNFDLNASKPCYTGLGKLEEYWSIQKWLNQIKKRRTNKADREVPRGTKYQIKYAITSYCNFLSMTPDEIIKDAKKEKQLTYSVDKHNDHLDDFIQYAQKEIKGVSKAHNYCNQLIAFYRYNGIPITTQNIKRTTLRELKGLNTDEIKQIYKKADIEHGSWILANSYMALPVRQLVKLTVDDFNVEQWREDRPLYPVNIRKEVSDTIEYTTFIGSDARKVLEYYFSIRKFKGQDKPWNYSFSTLTRELKRLSFVIGVIDSKYGMKDGVPRGFFPIVPRSLEFRLRSILEESGVPPNWTKILTGHLAGNSAKPSQEQLYDAYLRAIAKLQVFSDFSQLNLPTTLTQYSTITKR